MHFPLIAVNLEILLWSESHPSERPSSTPDKQLPSSHALSHTPPELQKQETKWCIYKEKEKNVVQLVFFVYRMWKM